MGAKLLSDWGANRWLFVPVVVLVAAGLIGLAVACGTTPAETSSNTAVSAQSTLSTQAMTTTVPAATSASTTEWPSTTSTSALIPMSTAEIAQWKKNAIAFVDRVDRTFPDAAAQFAEFANDATFYDPSDGDFVIEGKQSIVQMQQGFNQSFPGIKTRRTAVYLSAAGAAFATTENVWPPWVPEPADHPATNDLQVFRFTNGQVASWDMWFSAPTLEMVSFGWFAPGKGGPQQLQKIADRYMAAWSSADKTRIAALYRNDAVFADTMLGLQARGLVAISELSQKRFDPRTKVTFKIIDLYAQTNGSEPPTDQIPQNGAIIGVGIHYRCTQVLNGKSKTVEGLTTFELGTRQGKSFAPDPDGLITREEVFHDVDSLLKSGLVR